MSIRVRGSLLISRKNGRRGAFNIGELRTEIGEFEVKDALIEEYEEGNYTGEFVINWIEPDSVCWHGKVFVKNRAQLDAIIIDAVDDAPAPRASLPPDNDPMESDAGSRIDAAERGNVEATPDVASGAPASALANTAPVNRSPARHPVPTANNSPAAAADDHQLFGDELHALLVDGLAIKLDPTVDRMAFRAQRDRLKALGYGFDAKSQTWSIHAD